MPPINFAIAALIDTARELLAHRTFDADVAVELLDRLMTHTLDTQAVGAVTHARMLALKAIVEPTASQAATARFALARVVTLLNRQRG